MCGQENADYAFLMDASGSILPDEFQELKDFVKQVIDFLRIGPSLTHIGVIEYSRGANMELSFSTSYDKEEIKRLVDNVTHTAGITRIDLALKVASEELFTSEGGMRETARKVKLVKVFMYSQLHYWQPQTNSCCLLNGGVLTYRSGTVAKGFLWMVFCHSLFCSVLCCNKTLTCNLLHKELTRI